MNFFSELYCNKSQVDQNHRDSPVESNSVKFPDLSKNEQEKSTEDWRTAFLFKKRTP